MLKSPLHYMLKGARAKRLPSERDALGDAFWGVGALQAEQAAPRLGQMTLLPTLLGDESLTLELAEHP